MATILSWSDVQCDIDSSAANSLMRACLTYFVGQLWLRLRELTLNTAVPLAIKPTRGPSLESSIGTKIPLFTYCHSIAHCMCCD